MLKNLLLSIILMGYTVPLEGQNIQQDSSTYIAIQQLHKSIKNYTVTDEILLFKTIRDTIASELEILSHKGIRYKKERIKIFFEELYDNLTIFKTAQEQNDSLFLCLQTSQEKLFAEYAQGHLKNKKAYKNRRKELGVSKQYKAYKKNERYLDKKRETMLLNSEQADEFFTNDGWESAPFSELIFYINQALLSIQKTKWNDLEQTIGYLEKQFQYQMDSLNNIATSRIEDIAQKKEIIETQQVRIASLAESVELKNKNSEALTAEIVYREAVLDSIQLDLGEKKWALRKIQNDLNFLKDESKQIRVENRTLASKTNDLTIDIDSLRTIGVLQAKQNNILVDKQKKLEQEKFQAETWLKGLTAMSIFGILLLGIATNRMNNEKKKVTKAYTEIQRTKDLLQLKTEELNLSHRELNHRIKNNLQQISSLIYLQEEEIEDERARASFNALQGRIDTIKIVHQKLYTKKQQQLTMVNMQEYLTDLIKFIVGSEAHLTIDIPNLAIEMDHATDIGLIVNELVTNSSKYAFSNTANPTLAVNIKVAQNKLYLTIRDNGPGFPVGFSLDSISSFGLTSIVEMFVYKSGKGTLQTYNDNGAVVEVVVPFDVALGQLIA